MGMDEFYLAGPQPGSWHRYLEAENKARAEVGIAPTCLDCKVAAVRFITTPAQLYGIPAEDFAAYPGVIQPRWDGEWYCPRCRHLVGITDLRKVSV